MTFPIKIILKGPNVNFFVANCTYADCVSDVFLKSINSYQYEFGIIMDDSEGKIMESIRPRFNMPVYGAYDKPYYQLIVEHDPDDSGNYKTYSFIFIDMDKIFDDKLFLVDYGEKTSFYLWLESCLSDKCCIISTQSIYAYLQTFPQHTQLNELLGLLNTYENIIHMICADDNYYSRMHCYNFSTENTKCKIITRDILLSGNISDVYDQGHIPYYHYFNTETNKFVYMTQSDRTSGYVNCILGERGLITNFVTMDLRSLDKKILGELSRLVFDHEQIGECNILRLKKYYDYVNNNCYIKNITFKEHCSNYKSLLRKTLLSELTKKIDIILDRINN